MTDKTSDAAEAAGEAVSATANAVKDTVTGAAEQLSGLSDKAADTAAHLNLDGAASWLNDRRALVVAALAGITVTLVLRRRGAKTRRGPGVTKGAAKRFGRTLTR